MVLKQVVPLKNIKGFNGIETTKIQKVQSNLQEKPKKIARIENTSQSKKSISLPSVIDPNEFVVSGPVELNLETPEELRNLTIQGPTKLSLPEDSVLGNLSFQDSVMASEWSTTGILLLGREKEIGLTPLFMR